MKTQSCSSNSSAFS